MRGVFRVPCRWNFLPRPFWASWLCPDLLLQRLQKEKGVFPPATPWGSLSLFMTPPSSCFPKTKVWVLSFRSTCSTSTQLQILYSAYILPTRSPSFPFPEAVSSSHHHSLPGSSDAVLSLSNPVSTLQPESSPRNFRSDSLMPLINPSIALSVLGKVSKLLTWPFAPPGVYTVAALKLLTHPN